MPDNESFICPVCGNLMQDGACWRCRANKETKAKRWRTGDHGGKRPERVGIESTHQVQPRSLSHALNGSWRSLQRDVRISINTKTRTYRSTHPKKAGETIHRFSLIEEDGRELRFMKDTQPIQVRVGDDGIVRMKAGDMELGFVYLHDGTELRTCPVCFAKVPTSIVFCDECDWSFGTAFG